MPMLVEFDASFPAATSVDSPSLPQEFHFHPLHVCEDARFLSAGALHHPLHGVRTCGSDRIASGVVRLLPRDFRRWKPTECSTTMKKVAGSSVRAEWEVAQEKMLIGSIMLFGSSGSDAMKACCMQTRKQDSSPSGTLAEQSPDLSTRDGACATLAIPHPDSAQQMPP